MLNRLIQRTEEGSAGSIDYKCEYRDAEYEYEKTQDERR